jgi:hypothetical protein
MATMAASMPMMTNMMTPIHFMDRDCSQGFSRLLGIA